MILNIENQLTHKVYEFKNLDDKMESRLFYSFDIQLPEGIEDGIYQYKLFDNGIIKATGLLQCGDFIPEKAEYKNNKNTYIQYNSN